MDMKMDQHTSRALLINHDPLLGELVSHQLAGSGIECIHLTSYEEAVLYLDRKLRKTVSMHRDSTASTSPGSAELDVIVLDRELNGSQTGLPLCQLIRDASDVPVVMLTGDKSPQATVPCLAEGADQYISEPFLAEELVAHIGASIRDRRSRRYPAAVTLPSVMAVNVQQREVVFAGMAVSLSEKESLLAEILVRHLGLPVSKDELFAHVYGKLSSFQTRCLDVLVGRLRKKLAFTGNRCRVLSVRNRGYKLVVNADA